MSYPTEHTHATQKLNRTQFTCKIMGLPSFIPRLSNTDDPTDHPDTTLGSHFNDSPRCLQVTMFLCCATILAIIQYCNFCQLSFWMRSVLATATGVVLLLLLYSPLHRYR